MAVITRVEPIDRDIQLMLAQDLSPTAQSAAFAALAKEFIAEGDETNRSILGRIPPRKTYVDGTQGASIENVKPGGVIVAEWELIGDVLKWIAIALEESSPVGRGKDKHPGLYKKSHTLFADGSEVKPGAQIPPAQEYTFLNALPYSRKIDRGSSRQFPDGVYQVIAKIAASKFGNIASIKFSFRATLGGEFFAISRIGPLQVKRNAHGQYLKGSHTRAGNQQERDMRVPAIVVKVG